MRRAPFVLLLGLVAVAACGETLPSPSPAGPTPAVEAPPVANCPDRPFDAGAPLDPEFRQDIFVNDESRRIAEDWVAGLEAIYARAPDADPCRYFTARGLATARLADPRLLAALRAETAVDGDLELRIAFEGTYDLRNRPPVVPLDPVFDLVAGARVTDLVSSETRVTAGDERAGLHVEFMFDGHRWRADRVGPISVENANWARLPAPVAPGAPCSGFSRDGVGAPFDERPERRWCDGDGKGRIVRQPEQLSLIVRYPCGQGHAAVLTIGRPLGVGLDPLVHWEYVRDPAGEFLVERWVTAPFDGDASLPPDAAYTGWTNGNVELWISPSALDQAIYLVRGGVVERWPRAAAEWGVIDCN